MTLAGTMSTAPYSTCVSRRLARGGAPVVRAGYKRLVTTSARVRLEASWCARRKGIHSSGFSNRILGDASQSGQHGLSSKTPAGAAKNHSDSTAKKKKSKTNEPETVMSPNGAFAYAKERLWLAPINATLASEHLRETPRLVQDCD
eukprot:1184845-Prorocentrum_minimum.AAC.3